MIRGSASPLRIASASLTTAPSTQPPLTDAGDLAVAVDRHRRTGLAWTGTFDVDHAGDGHCLAGGTPAIDVVQQFTHQDLLVDTPGDHAGQFFHCCQRMTFHEVINIRQRGRHPTGQRRVPGCDLQRVDPDQVVGDALQAAHLLAEQLPGRRGPSRR